MTITKHRLRPADELDRLYRAHAAQVHAVCASVLRDRSEAEDAAQQVFVSAFCALRGGTVPRDPGAWLATIARNESRTRARRLRAVPLPELQDAAQEDPATLVARQDELASIWRAIETLPQSQRDALLLRELRGLSYDELAADLELSHQSVRSLLNRARHTLRAQLRRGAAALAGAPWLNMLVRLFGEGPSPAVSSASRTAAVGVGALVLTGGAALVPLERERVLHPRPQPVVPRVVAAPRAARKVERAAVMSVPVHRAVVVVLKPKPVAQVRDDRGSDHRDSTGRSGSGSDSRGGPDPVTTTTAVVISSSDDGGGGGGPGPSTTTTAVVIGSSDGGGPGSSSRNGVGSDAGPGPSSGSDGGSSGSGSDGGH